MFVKTAAKGHTNAILYVGARNAKKYFDERNSVVTFTLDHLCIDCPLSPEFWHGHPEIDDPRLSEWLRFKILKDASARTSIPLEMVPVGDNSFRLVPGKPAKKH